ncbi:hypothetical protein Syun_009268 [Stephania yunnanensis]|uniref:Uncharacterized protein n=1 Tax=Stephania yunnanensis TaxID=152371 RepID=A0AAP0KGA7_9MAGN
MEVKERSKIFYAADTFVLDDHDAIESFVLEVLNELPNLKESVYIALPKAIDAQFVVDISKGDDITPSLTKDFKKRRLLGGNPTLFSSCIYFSFSLVLVFFVLCYV